jgi:hypothetical protein
MSWRELQNVLASVFEIVNPWATLFLQVSPALSDRHAVPFETIEDELGRRAR